MQDTKITSPLTLRLLGLTCIVLASLAFAAPARCQGAPPGPLEPLPGVEPEKAPPPSQKPNAIRVRVSEVTAPVTVRDKNGEMVLNLTKTDFHVFDNGVEQKIDHFDLGGDALSVVLAVETSSRIEVLLPAVRKTGIVFTQTVMAQTAEAAVIGFDDTVDVLDKFTTDPESVQNAINHLREGTSGTRVYDAMARGVSMLEGRPEARRRILVVVGEAQDSGSESKLGEVLRAAQLANVTIYSIGLSTTAAEWRAKPAPYQPPQMGPPGTFPVPTPNGTPQTPEIERQMQSTIDLGALAKLLVTTAMNAIGPNSLAVASKATGGLHVNTMKDRSVEKAMDAIGGELHAQYTLSYRPTPTDDEPSGYHEIKITLDRPDVDIRTRPGYYLAP
jgi:VWFA-related protein